MVVLVQDMVHMVVVLVVVLEDLHIEQGQLLHVLNLLDQAVLVMLNSQFAQDKKGMETLVVEVDKVDI